MVILLFSIIVTMLFFIYGYNCFYLLYHARRYEPPKSYDLSSKPRVAIHLPIYNEAYVVDRLLQACINMANRYGRSKVNIMVLDDSTDQTTQIAKIMAERYRVQGYKVQVLHRNSRQGYKAGALQNALKRTEEEFIAVFDSDFTPPPDFLEKTVPYLVQKPRAGLVQCRWSHINREYNSLTTAISIGMDGHFFIEQPGRYTADCFLNFNGSGGIIRRKALVDAGGWHADTLAEDLDASYRMQLKGYEVVYLRDITTLSEITPTITSFKRQQGRWACGSTHTARKILLTILQHSGITIKRKIEAFIHLTYYSVHLLMVSAFILASTAAILGVTSISFPQIDLTGSRGLSAIELSSSSITLNNVLPVLFSATIIICTSAAWIYYMASLRMQRISLKRSFPYLILLGFIGYGISISNSVEVLKGLFTKREWTFKRTPKYAVKKKQDEWRGKRYQVPLSRTVLLEIGAGVLGLVSMSFAANSSNWGLIPILGLYTSAYFLVSFLTVVQSGQDA